MLHPQERINSGLYKINIFDEKDDDDVPSTHDKSLHQFLSKIIAVKLLLFVLRYLSRMVLT